MNWLKFLYVLLIVLVYVPMVFLGANVFFPKFTGSHSYYQPPADCYGKYPYPEKLEVVTGASPVAEAQRTALDAQRQKCFEEQKAEQDKFDEEKRLYDGQKYVFITLFNLAILLLALFLPLGKETSQKKGTPAPESPQKESIILGLFVGSIIATFGATIQNFDSRSKVGFMILVIIFLAMLYFIYKRKIFSSGKNV